MLNPEALQKILGISERVSLTDKEMVRQLRITFFPHIGNNTSKLVLDFKDRLETALKELGAEIVPYKETLEQLPIKRVLRRFFKISGNNILYGLSKVIGFHTDQHYINLNSFSSLLRRTRVKKGISIIAIGEQILGNLPMEYIYSFKDNSVITLLDFPKNITDKSLFEEHFNTSMAMFAHHMTNIVIAVDKDKWMLYNFNASHPIYPFDSHFKEHILSALIPKIVAPIRPHTLSEFVIKKEPFDTESPEYKAYVDDLITGALLFGKTKLYPDGKKIDELPFRNSFYQWIGKLHLDNRNGMSFGFLAKQLPTKLSDVLTIEEACEKYGEKVKDPLGFFTYGDDIYLIVSLLGKQYVLKTPEVWVLSQRSGSDKTHINPQKDLLKLGLNNGKLTMQVPKNLKLDNHYRPSFDTKVILAHALGNSIIASLLNRIQPDSFFLKQFKEKGVSLSHWHGYINPQFIPRGWFIHGNHNPHVACSSPQSAVYALEGKLFIFEKALQDKKEYRGDIHIEPHHGININYLSTIELAQSILDNPQMTSLGNKYFYLYT